ncbi:RNA-directed DNA polymerase, eukaryota [Tanacetum coccineum]
MRDSKLKRLFVVYDTARFCVGIVCVEDGTVFSSQNGSGDGSGLKEKNQNQVLSNEAAKVGIIPSDIGNGGEAYGFVTSNVFGSKEGMEAILESYTWSISNVSLILKQWTPDANIIKEVVCDIPVWVKFHDVPIIAFIEDGLSVVFF